VNQRSKYVNYAMKINVTPGPSPFLLSRLRERRGRRRRNIMIEIPNRVNILLIFMPKAKKN
jgi:hypothetical protein